MSHSTFNFSKGYVRKKKQQRGGIHNSEHYYMYAGQIVNGRANR